MYRFYNPEHTAIVSDDNNKIIPVDSNNRDYAAILASNTVISDYQAPASANLVAIESKVFRYTLTRAGYRAAFNNLLANTGTSQDTCDYFEYSPNIYLQNRKFLRVWSAMGKSNTDLSAFVTLAQQIMAE